MSKPFWRDKLHLITGAHKRLAVVGVGHELRGDDAAGLLVARHLQTGGAVLVVEAGPAPENVGGMLRDFAPDAIVVVDAAQMNLPPGSIDCLDAAALTGITASSHTLPLHLVATFWEKEFACEVNLFGIQPGTTEFGAPITPAVRTAVRALALALAETLALQFLEDS